MGSITVLVCALELLGRSASSMPPIKVLALPPADVSVNAEGFVRGNDGIIYVVAVPRFSRASVTRLDLP